MKIIIKFKRIRSLLLYNNIGLISMKKIKKLSFFLLGVVLLLPFVKISPAQESYVGTEVGNEYLWKLGVYKQNWTPYLIDNMGGTLSTLWPLGGSTMSQVYFDYLPWQIPPPQTHWPFEILTMGSEETGSILTPFDNSTITFTSIYARAGWVNSKTPSYNSYYNGTWYIASNTSSFLRQTYNLSLSFSPYGIMSVPFAPMNINWTSFVSEFLEVMNTRGGLYKNISTTTYSNGYSLYIPPWGFENNSAAMDIHVRYDSKGVLRSWEFLYGDILLVRYWIGVPDTIPLEDMLTLIWGGGIVVGVGLIVIIMRWVLRHNN